MTTYLLESNLTSWAIEAESPLIAACAWVMNGMRDEDEGQLDHVTARAVGERVTHHPLRISGVKLIEAMREKRQAIETAARTVRLVDHTGRRLLRAEARCDEQNERIGYLEGCLRSIAEDVTKGQATPEQISARVRLALGGEGEAQPWRGSTARLGRKAVA